jgi:predicted nucleic acid-binding protein
MSDKTFFDTNILVYALGPFDAKKSITARRLLLESFVSRQGIISYQVVQEFLNLALRKFSTRVTATLAAEYLDEVIGELKVVPWSLDLMESGLGIAMRYKFSWYDSLIVAAALKSGCTTLCTEDLQSGQIIDGLKIVNPFFIDASTD